MQLFLYSARKIYDTAEIARINLEVRFLKIMSLNISRTTNILFFIILDISPDIRAVADQLGSFRIDIGETTFFIIAVVVLLMTSFKYFILNNYRITVELNFRINFSSLKLNNGILIRALSSLYIFSLRRWAYRSRFCCLNVQQNYYFNCTSNEIVNHS